MTDIIIDPAGYVFLALPRHQLRRDPVSHQLVPHILPDQYETAGIPLLRLVNQSAELQALVVSALSSIFNIVRDDRDPK